MSARASARIFDERRRVMVAGLRRIGLGVGAPPTGAFYVLANARRFTGDSLAFAFEILERAHVGVTPGVDFGRNAEGYLRFSYAQSLERIQEAMARIGRFLSRPPVTDAACVMCGKYGRSDGPLHIADLARARACSCTRTSSFPATCSWCCAATPPSSTSCPSPSARRSWRR